MSGFPRPAADPEPGGAPTDLIKIVLADGHTAMRQSLRLLLDGEPDFDVVAETDCLPSMMHRLRATHPDVLVFDQGLMGHGYGIQTLSRLHREAFDIRMVMLTMSDSAAFARGALDNGAFGLVLKEMADSDLPAAVRRAASGRRYVSPALAAKLSGARAV